ncbi:MAG: sigma 54-interacting transcriptional regulator, partial [Pseudomonadota bacterium]
VARAGLNVLIEGGSGTGKELFARYLHACGAEDQPLVTLNCASLPQDLLDAELFGIEQGVATGVVARPGKFEQADGGVIFLDEIGDMHTATQAKLLRVLQEREVYRIGGSKPRRARTQVVSATNRNLKNLVDRGEFRLDLYHRIVDWMVRLPDLQERPVDIANLAGYFLRAGCTDLGHRFGGISRAALDSLQAYQWPGNVRELEREMKRCALFLDDGEPLRSDHLDARVRAARAERMADGYLKTQLRRTEKRAIEQSLALYGGDVAKAAERLGIGKSTLYRQIRKLEIDIG